MIRAVVLGCSLLLAAEQAKAQGPYEDVIGTGSEPGASPEEIQAALGSAVVQQITLPQALAFGPGELADWAKKAKSAYESLKAQAGPGDTSENYDVIIQPGHYLRPKGATGGQGKHVLEREVAAWIVGGLAADLKNRGLKVAVIPADGFNKPLKGKIFLSLHTDASTFPCSLGPSIGYDSVGDALGMHGIAAALAITMEVDPVKFMRDNYTKNLKGYYAFGSMNVELFEGVLEMAELTCPAEEERILSRAELLTRNLAIAVALAAKPPQ